MIYLIAIMLLLLNSCGAEDKPQKMQYTVPSSEPVYTIEPRKDTETIQTPIPEKTDVPVKKNDNVVAEFTTPLLDKSENRVHNIKLASETVNGYMLKNGSEFSFNKIVGERSIEKGYKNAPVLVGTEHREGIGGGVCQTATTVYNAAKKANMNITEHHTHKTEVAYAKNGTDSTVNYDDLDLKFKNNLGCDVRIEVKVNKNHVSAKIIRI